MAITVIDPGEGALSRALARFGEQVAGRLNEKNLREKQLRENPAQMQALSAAARAAQKAGTLEQFTRGLNVRPEFVDQILSFQPNVQELTDVANITEGNPQLQARANAGNARTQIATNQAIADTGLPGLQIGAEAGTAQVTTAKNQATLQSGIIGRAMDNEVLKAMLEGRALSAQDKAMIPEEEVGARLEEIRAKNAENQFSGSVFRRRSAQGIDRLTVDTERVKLLADQANISFEQGALEKYKARLDAMDPNSHEYQTAITALSNPNELSHIQFHENLSFSAGQSALDRASRTSEGISAGDLFANTVKYQDTVNGLVKIAQDDGLSDEERKAASASIQNWRLIGQQMMNQGQLFNMDTIGSEDQTGMMGGFKGVELFVERVGSQRVAEMLGAIADGNATAQDLSARNAQGQSALDLLDAREREEFIKNYPEALRNGQAQGNPQAQAQINTQRIRGGLPHVRARLESLRAAEQALIPKSQGTNPTGFSTAGRANRSLESIRSLIRDAEEQIKVMENLQRIAPNSSNSPSSSSRPRSPIDPSIRQNVNLPTTQPASNKVSNSLSNSPRPTISSAEVSGARDLIKNLPRSAADSLLTTAGFSKEEITTIFGRP